MKVSDLIAALKSHPQDAVVRVAVPNSDDGNDYLLVDGVKISNAGIVIINVDEYNLTCEV